MIVEFKRRSVILLADVCADSPLFMSVGDSRVVGTIGDCIDDLDRIARDSALRVARSKKDEVCCAFAEADDALATAAAMTAEHAKDGVMVHVVLHYGGVFNGRSGLHHGPGVAEAAYMLQMAEPGQVLATDDFVQQLSKSARADMRLCGRWGLYGRQSTTDIFSAVPRKRSRGWTASGFNYVLA